MLQDHILKIIQAIIALILLILTIVYWKDNHIGENIINFEAVILWIIGLEHIVIPFRWINGKQTFEYEVSLLLFSIYTLGQLFRTDNPNHVMIKFNVYCKYNILVPLIINFVFILIVMLVVFLYAVRHIYRLMTENLLSTNTNLAPEELNKIMDLKRPYGELMEINADISQTCSICLLDFE